MAKLTKMQQKIYDYIAETTQQQGYPPLCGRSARLWVCAPRPPFTFI